MFVVIEILDEDGNDNSLVDDPAFAVEQLGWMERDRAAGGYVTLDGTNYAMPVRIVGTASPMYNSDREYVVEPLKDPQ